MVSKKTNGRVNYEEVSDSEEEEISMIDVMQEVSNAKYVEVEKRISGMELNLQKQRLIRKEVKRICMREVYSKLLHVWILTIILLL